MPTIIINKEDLERLCKTKIKIEELKRFLEKRKIFLGFCNGNDLTLEIADTNRADLLSVEGIAREIKGILGKEKGIPTYRVENSNFVVKVDKKVKNVRPHTACAVVKNLKFDNHSINQIIQLQEKLSETYGKKRREAAIGIYDFDKIKWPITYTTFKPEALSFIPLGMVEILNLKQILEKHEKGKEYGHLLKGYKEYPIFIDAEKNVLSMPPIINSDYSGKITENTKNVFVEVSGFDFMKISFILNIIVSALAERGGTINRVKIKYSFSPSKIITPDLKTKFKVINVEEINSLLGTNINENEIIKLFEKSRFNARVIDKKSKKIIVEVPFYRKDVLHNVDLIEEIAMIYGYENITPIEPQIYSIGSLLEESKLINKIAENIVGLGFQEILSFIMSNEKEQFEKMNLINEEVIKIKNPVSETFTCLRKSLLPSLMKFFSFNIDKNYPQKIFEIGKVVFPDEKTENKSKENLNMAFAISHSKANLSEAIQVLKYLFRDKKLELKAAENPSFIPGRCAEIVIENEKNKLKKSVGILGEIHPKVLSKWKLRMPIVALEINLSELYG